MSPPVPARGKDPRGAGADRIAEAQARLMGARQRVESALDELSEAAGELYSAVNECACVTDVEALKDTETR